MLTSKEVRKYINKLVTIQGIDVWGYVLRITPPEGLDADVNCIVTLEVTDPTLTSGNELEFWNIPCDLEEIVIQSLH